MMVDSSLSGGGVLRVATWNTGRSMGVGFVQLLMYSNNINIDILCLQECDADKNFKNIKDTLLNWGYQYVANKHVVTLIRSDLALFIKPKGVLKHKSGRLLNIKIRTSGEDLNVTNAYFKPRRGTFAHSPDEIKDDEERKQMYKVINNIHKKGNMGIVCADLNEIIIDRQSTTLNYTLNKLNGTYHPAKMEK